MGTGGERMRSGGEWGGADGERPHKKLRFLETFLRYFEEFFMLFGMEFYCIVDIV